MSAPRCGLDRVLGAFAERGDWIPTAVGHAIASQLLDDVVDGGGSCVLADVELDENGQAFLRRAVGPAAMVDLVRILVAGDQDRFAPCTAWPALSALEGARGDSAEVAVAQVRDSLRTHLPPPAPEDELARLVCTVVDSSSGEPDWEALPTRIGPATSIGEAEALPAMPRPTSVAGRPASVARPTSVAGRPASVARPTSVAPSADADPLSAPVPAPPLDIQALTGVPEPAALSDPPAAPPLAEPSERPSEPYAVPPASHEEAERRAMANAGPVLDSIAAEGRARESDPTASGERRVVRHQLPRSDKPVTLTRAPAARRSARASLEGDDVIFAGDDRGYLMWFLVLAALAGAMYLLFYQ